MFSVNCALLTYLFTLSVSDINFAKDPVICGYGSTSPQLGRILLINMLCSVNIGGQQ